MSIFRVVLTATMFGQTCQNVLHFNDNGANLTTLAVGTTIRDQWLSTYKFLQHNQVVWIDIATTQVSPVVSITNHLVVNVPGTSNAATAADVPVICYLVRVQTTTPGRTGRGRIYSPGPSISGSNLGVLTAPTIGAVQNQLNLLLTNFGPIAPPSGLTFGIAPRGNEGDFKPAISMNVKPTYGTQRRRNYGVGV